MTELLDRIEELEKKVKELDEKFEKITELFSCENCTNQSYYANRLDCRHEKKGLCKPGVHQMWCEL